MNPVSVCSWVSRKFWREGASSRSRIRKSSVLGWEITAPRSSWIFPSSPPATPGWGRPASPSRVVSWLRTAWWPWYLDPAVISVLGLWADGQLAAGLPGQLCHGIHKMCVVPHTVDEPRESDSGQTQARGAARVRRTRSMPQTHRHTYTSRGGRVLGVIIQGATRNTTVSVKMGDSEKSCRGRAERTEPWPWVQRPSDPRAGDPE